MRSSAMSSVRAAVRSQRSAVRFNSTSSSSASSSASSAAASASSSAKAAGEKAGEQAQKAADQAQKMYNQGAEHVKRIAGPIGDRVGSALGSYREPLVFNFKVFTSLCRQVYRAEKLAPPTDLHTIATAYSSIFSRARNPEFWQKTLKSGAWAGLAVATVEAWAVFKVGEIIGRRNLVGYKLKE